MWCLPPLMTALPSTQRLATCSLISQRRYAECIDCMSGFCSHTFINRLLHSNVRYVAAGRPNSICRGSASSRLQACAVRLSCWGCQSADCCHQITATYQDSRTGTAVCKECRLHFLWGTAGSKNTGKLHIHLPCQQFLSQQQQILLH